MRKISEKYRVEAVHFTDLYPSSFLDFRKKYLKHKDRSYHLYVQFTNHMSDSLHKKAYDDPDHSDPVAIYAYPIKYVLTHPADIWYGRTAKYMRVLENTSKKPLYLKEINSESQCRSMLFRAGFDDIEKKMKLVRKHYKHRTSGPNTWAKTFMSVMQLDLDKPIEKDYGKLEFPLRSGKEQTDLFLKMGYDALIDDSRNNNQAIINDREPEQIAFLKRNAFKVVEVFHLRRKETDKILTYTGPDDVERKLAAGLAKVMDDSLASDSPERSNLGGRSLYWTKKGRRIGISFIRPQTYYEGKKLGEKKHKEDKLHTSHQTQVEIQSEYGTYEKTFWSDAKFSEIISAYRSEWLHLKTKEPNQEWSPESKKSFNEKREAQKKERIREMLEKERIEKIESVLDDHKHMKKLADLLNLPFSTKNDPEMEYRLYDFLAYFSRVLSRSVKDLPLTAEQFNSLWSEAVQGDEASFENLKSLHNEAMVSQVKDILGKLYTTYDTYYMKNPYSQASYGNLSYPASMRISFILKELEELAAPTPD